jgi:hypothetical protein
MTVVVLRAIALFLYQTIGALVITLIVALLWTLARGEGFLHTFLVSLYVFGTLAVLLGAVGVGGMSPSSGFLGGGGRIPGLKSTTYVDPDGTMGNGTAILLFTGAALIAIALAV